MNLPALVLWLTGLISVLFFKAEKKYRIFAYIYVLTVFIILLFSGKSYYTLGLYPILFALGGYAVDKYFKTSVKYGVLVFMILISFLMLPFSLPIYSHEKMAEISKKTAEFTNTWEDGKIHNIPQDYADMTGWKELSHIVIQQYNSLPKSARDSCKIFAGNYGQAGAINFYGKEYGLPVPISFNDNFVFWAPDSIDNVPLIYVDHEIGDVELLYNSYRLVGQVNNIYFRENGLKVYYCTQPKDTLRDYYAGRVKQLKDRYR